MLDQANREKLGRLAQRVWRERKVPHRLLDNPKMFLEENGVEIPPGWDAHAAADKDSLSFRFKPRAPGRDATELDSMQSSEGSIFFRFEFKLNWD